MFNFRLHSSSERNPDVKHLRQTLLRWVNGIIYDQNVIVRDLNEDMADGQVLLACLSKITGETLPVEVGVTDKIKSINMNTAFKFMQTKFQLVFPKNVQEGIMNKDVVSILLVLVELSKKTTFPYKLPSKVQFQIAVTYDEEVMGVLKTKTVLHSIDLTRSNEEPKQKPEAEIIGPNELKKSSSQVNVQQQPDPFDLIFESGKEKIDIAIKSITTGANKHLNSLGYTCTNISEQFRDGVLLVFLLGCSGKFFIPLYNFKMSDNLSHEDKKFNISFVIKHLREMGIDKSFSITKIMDGDLKETLRIAYTILKL